MKRGRIFVFGSNMLGIHGAGAAKFAFENYGARWGIVRGLSGDSYALPTCSKPGIPRTKEEIVEELYHFRRCAEGYPELDFLLTSIGCGHAGYNTEEIRSLLVETGPFPDNVYIQAGLAMARGPTTLAERIHDAQQQKKSWPDFMQTGPRQPVKEG